METTWRILVDYWETTWRLPLVLPQVPPLVPPLVPSRAKRVGFFKLGSGIGKKFGFGSGTGIGTVYLINRVLSGNANIDRVFPGILIYAVYVFNIRFNIWMVI